MCQANTQTAKSSSVTNAFSVTVVYIDGFTKSMPVSSVYIQDFSKVSRITGLPEKVFSDIFPAQFFFGYDEKSRGFSVSSVNTYPKNLKKYAGFGSLSG